MSLTCEVVGLEELITSEQSRGVPSLIPVSSFLVLKAQTALPSDQAISTAATVRIAESPALVYESEMPMQYLRQQEMVKRVEELS